MSGILGGKQRTTTTTDVPQWIKDASMGALQGAQNLAGSYQPYTGQLTADITPAMQSYWNTLTNLGNSGLGNDLLSQAAGLAGGPNNITAGQVQGSTYNPTLGQNAFTFGGASIDPSQLASAGMVDRSSIGNVGLGQLTKGIIQEYFNSFEDTAVQSALGDYERARQMQGQQDAATAQAAGAFGGSRHGVADALTNEAFQRTSQGAVNNLRLGGYNTAISTALQDRAQQLQGQIANQNADLSVAGMNNQAGMFNAGQRNQGLFQNAGFQQQAGLFNAGALNDLLSQNLGYMNQAGQFNAGQTQQANLANQSANLQAAIQNRGFDMQGAGLLAGLSGQQVSQAAQLAGLLGTAAGQQQGYAQDALDRNSTQYQQNLQNQIALQQLINSALAGLPNLSTTTQTTRGGAGAGLLGGLGSIFQGLGAMDLTFSDMRLKRDIRHLTHDHNGVRWTTFRYAWDGPEVIRVGVIAQEVQALKPEAVNDDGPFLRVDYRRLA